MEIEEIKKEQDRQAKEQTSMMKEIIALHECKGDLVQTLGEYRAAVEKNEHAVERNERVVNELSETLEKLNDNMEAFIDAKRSIRWLKSALVFFASIAGSIYAIILLFTNKAFKEITNLFGG